MSEEPPPDEPLICLYPGCERPAMTQTKGGPPPRYCDIEQHNANTTYRALEKQKAEAGGGS
ncbi:MAG: hypothetical protein QOJ35_94 [Solirubrobacteraceae bacterium]|jgi:hypothetical protein|nr:hypothetical protein [Solirubrobacteraceae bacterium]